jgi:hypothetical protein
MPSPLHDMLLQLFNNRPDLAPELLRTVLRVHLPAYSEVRISSADLTDVQPTEYRADLVLQLVAHKPVLGVIVEVQLSRDERKKFVWPVYAITLRARLKCPICLLVVTAKETIARWAAKPIDIGNECYFVPRVIGPSGVPQVTDPVLAEAAPELAVLSAIAHGRGADVARSVEIAHTAQAAIRGLDEDRLTMYFDLIESSLSAAARRELQAMNPRKYEYRSAFARKYEAQGQLKGEVSGRAALILRQLTVRFGSLPADAQAHIEQASIAELDAIGERLLTATTPQEALGSH